MTPGLRAIYDVPAPAKLNLFLHVVGRRPDGYHLIQSVFMLIDWCDTLHFELRRDGKITRSDLAEDNPASDAHEPLPEVDLTVRAAQALQKASGTALGVHITLQKRIPSQAGMGGGSSDAASCLLALQRLWDTKLTRAQLHAVALGLGADVPFFLCGKHAWVEGIGESMQPITLPPGEFVVLKPPVGLPTSAIFSSPLLKRDSEAAKLTGFAAATESHPFEFGKNDLQSAATSLCSAVSQSIDWFSAQGLKGRMTGSGSAVFAYLPPEKKLPNADDLSARGWKIRVCKNLEMHPLADW